MRGTKTVCSQCCKMMPRCWSILLLCLSTNAVYRKFGESITLECSSARCLGNIEECDGMYLYHYFKKWEEVLFYFSKPGSTDKITPRERYKNRIHTKGSLGNHTVTISNLTVDDFGFYSCVYKTKCGDVQCNAHILVVRGEAPCYRSEEVPCAPANEKTLPMVKIIITTCIITMLLTMMLILLIVPRVKQWTRSRGTTTTRVLQASNDYVYEVMTKDGLRPLAAP